MRNAVASLTFLALAASGQAAAPGNADAQAPPTAAAAELSAADRASILRSQNLTADAGGMVENECGDKVAPQFLPADMGGADGTATLLAMGGGPNSATCYGDGPGLTLMMRDGANWRAIYSSRGGFMAIMPSQTRGVRDIAFAGPGFEHPLHTWNGTAFAPSGRSVADAAMANATFLP